MAKTPQPERLSEAEVLEHLSANRHPLTLRQIAEALDLSHAGRRDLKKIIEHLAHTGAIEETSSGHYRIPRPKSSGAEIATPVTPPQARGGGAPRHENLPAPAGRAAQRISSDPNRVS